MIPGYLYLLQLDVVLKDHRSQDHNSIHSMMMHGRREIGRRVQKPRLCGCMVDEKLALVFRSLVYVDSSRYRKV